MAIIDEGNGNPDLDILQRFMQVGFCAQRLGELIAFHLKKHVGLPSQTFPAGPPALT